jgi:cation:H+ antiporter
MTLLMFFLGLGFLVAGAEMLVRGARRLATSLGISPLVVGLTVVAFGTSTPELSVSVQAALAGKTDLAVGNMVGSNIFNILLILGLSALIAPLIVNAQIIRQEVPILIGSCFLLVGISLDQRISSTEGAVLLGALLAYTIFLIAQSRKESKGYAGPHSDNHAPVSAWDRPLYVQVILIFFGLFLLVVGSDWLVSASVTFARLLGVSEMVIGLTLVAAGTSMPEAATSVTAALRGERDIAVGNVIGSNTFNILGGLGVTGLVASGGIVVPDSFMNFDLWVMLAVTFACIPIFVTGREIARWEGAVFLAYYGAYVAYLMLASQKHDGLAAYSFTMMIFVIPLTVVTLLVLMIRRPAAG